MKRRTQILLDTSEIAWKLKVKIPDANMIALTTQNILLNYDFRQKSRSFKNMAAVPMAFKM